MAKAKTLTLKDMDTIRLALSYAGEERRSYMHATVGCDMDDAHDRAKALVDRFEKLHAKMFGAPTMHKAWDDEINAIPTVSIHDMGKTPTQ